MLNKQEEYLIGLFDIKLALFCGKKSENDFLREECNL